MNCVTDNILCFFICVLLFEQIQKKRKKFKHCDEKNLLLLLKYKIKIEEKMFFYLKFHFYLNVKYLMEHVLSGGEKIK